MLVRSHLKLFGYLATLFIVFCAHAQIGVGRRFGNTSSRNSGLNINYSSPKEYEIAEIAVTGVEFLDHNALISLSGLRVGDKIKIPGDAVSRAIKKLWKQGIIGNVEIYASKVEGGKIWLTIALTERPRLTKYEFTGINKTQEGELKDQIDLVRGKILTDVLVKNTELSVLKYLEGKGYLNAEVEITQEKDTLLGNSVKMTINIDKKRKVKIKDINFYGDDEFAASKLRSKLKNTGQQPRFTLIKDLVEKTLHLLNPKNLAYFAVNRTDVDKRGFSEYMSEHVYLNVFKSTKYVKSDFEEDKQTLISFYNAKGYRDAEIVTDSIYSISDKHMNVDFYVNPGQKYYFRDIIWTGNYIYTDDQLDKVLGVRAGDVYDLDLIQQKLNFNPSGVDVSALYMDDGYLFFNVTPVEVGIVEDSIDLEMRIFEGVQATINEVTISGNEKTNDHVVLRELRTLPGQKFSRSDLIRTQREVSQLGYFDPEQVNPVPKPNPMTETVDIEWQLVERANDQVELSGGWGGSIGFVGTLGVSFNNFSVKNIPHFDKWRPLPMGDGQKFGVRLQANGRQYQSYSVNFTEPWLGGKKPNAFGVSFTQTRSRRFQNGIREKPTGELGITGVTLSLGRRVTWPDDFFTISNSLGYQRYDLDNFGTSFGFDNSSSTSFTFNNTIARNSVDNPMYPRGGSKISLSASFTPPYSLWRNIDYDAVGNEDRFKFQEYHKWNFDLENYLKLAGDLVLASRMHLGFIGSYTDKVGVSPFERFTLGGSGLTGQNFLLGTDIIGLRGYADNSIQPRDDNGTVNTDDDINGGTAFTKFVMELRYPVSLNPSATIYGLAFFEGGNNWNDLQEFDPYNMMRSVGVGVRIFMPAFGLLGLDWGYGLDPAYGTNEISGAQFHFSIGQQIR